MQNSRNNCDSLTAAFIGETVVIRVKGRGSFRVSSALKQFVHQVIDRQSASCICLDMAECIGMDSTFMGVLAGLANFAKNKNGIEFKLFNLSEKNKKLLTTLGVDRVVPYSMSGSKENAAIPDYSEPPHETLETDMTDKLNTARTALEAHQILCKINSENYGKFKSVLEYLEADVKKLSR